MQSARNATERQTLMTRFFGENGAYANQLQYSNGSHGMTLRFTCFLLALLAILHIAPAHAGANPPDCDSCRIRIDSLDQPVKLSGKWLFTRDDAVGNKDVAADTSAWRVVKAPGPWKGAYEDRKVHSVGWYRGNLEFDPALVGQEVVLLINAYMGRVNVYVDGKEVYRRPGNINVERYYSTQAIPVRFTIGQPHQVIAIRVDTPLMTGVYQLPFELRRYNPHDAGLVGYQIMSGEMRMVASYVLLFFGCFFLLVYWKTRYSLYLVCALASIVIFPFFAAPNDYFMSLFEPETMLFLHYPGLGAAFLFFYFSQFFYRFTPKLNWLLGATVAAMGLTLGSLAFHPDLELFQHLRGIYFITCMICGVGTIYMLIRGVQHRNSGASILLCGMLVFFASTLNDTLLALGAIDSMALIFFGATTAITSMLYVASNVFANTFVENKMLAKDLTVMNENLEELVLERTQQLRQKTHDIQAMLQNMPQGVLTIQANNVIHPEYSAYLETIFETPEIAGRNLMALVFADTGLSPDALAQIEAATGACIGEDRMNFDFNAHLLVGEFDRRMPDGRIKSLELSWSPICDENDVIEKLMLCLRDVTEFKRLASEANAQKRELEIIGEILSVSQEKFHEFIERSLQFVEENERIIGETGGTGGAGGAGGTGDNRGDVVARLFRNMHTIKGNARTYGLLYLTSIVHEAEMTYDALRKDPAANWQPDLLLEQLAQVRTRLDEYAHINEHTLGRKGPGRRGSVEHFLMVDKEQIAQSLQLVRSVDPNSVEALRVTLAQLGATLSLIGTEKIGDILAGVVDSMPSLARELNKEPPRIVIEDNDIVVRNQIGGLLRNLFMHLFRNAMDHGIESGDRRLAAGKPAAGTIRLALGLEAGRFQLRFADDGAGLPVARIRAKALDMNLLSDPDASAEAVAQTIFVSGFSTAEQLTEVSGRGVGMDAVRGFLQKEGGDIQIRFLDTHETDNHRPFELLISLPESFAVRITP